MRPSHLAKLIASAAPLLASHRLRHRRRYETPFAISFLVTNRCSLSCAHCFYHAELAKPSDDELTLAEYERMSASMGRFGVGLFCGGEPFMRRDLADIIGLFRTNNGLPLAGVATNGQHTASLMRQTTKILTDHPHALFNLSFSLDGFPEVHDAIRGRGSFDRARRSWRECQRLAAAHPNLILSVTTVIQSSNQHTVPAFLRWLDVELEPTSASVLLVRQSPRAGDHLKAVTPARYLEAQDVALSICRRRAPLGRLSPHVRFLTAMSAHVHRTMVSGERSFHCHAGVHGALVDYKGDVNVCEVLSEDPSSSAIGNLRDHDMDFDALWNGAAADRMRKRVGRHRSCRGCTHETVGLLPSLAFGPNRLTDLLTAKLPAAGDDEAAGPRRLPVLQPIPGGAA